MAKEDIPPLGKVPKKRRQLEQALDVHIAMWLALPEGDLTPSERRRVKEEKQRRRDQKREVVVGFTGSRAGITPAQKHAVSALLDEWEVSECHHGDCRGADERFHSLCRGKKLPVICHPPVNNGLRAFCAGDRVEQAKDYQERNKDIVRVADRLIACPREPFEPEPAPGQGTWSTVRYARKRGDVVVRVIMPDGELQEEQQDG